MILIFYPDDSTLLLKNFIPSKFSFQIFWFEFIYSAYFPRNQFHITGSYIIDIYCTSGCDDTCTHQFKLDFVEWMWHDRRIGWWYIYAGKWKAIYIISLSIRLKKFILKNDLTKTHIERTTYTFTSSKRRKALKSASEPKMGLTIF